MMQSSKPRPLSYISFIETLTKQNIYQVLLNLALYLSFVLPLANQIQIPEINTPWKDVSNEISLIFILSGFGCMYWISGNHLRFWLISLRINIEFVLGLLSVRLGINSKEKVSPRKIYLKNKSFVSKSDIASYISRNDNKFLEKLYEERKEMDIKYDLNQENTVVTFSLLLLHWYFKSKFFVIISQYLPAFLPIVLLLLLLWSSAKSFPEDNEYFYIPSNPIRESGDSTQARKIEDLEQDIQQLSPEQLRQFRVWYEEFDSDKWDKQIEQDVNSGKLDDLASQALKEHKSGKTKKL